MSKILAFPAFTIWLGAPTSLQAMISYVVVAIKHHYLFVVTST
jgi:hypothetical protein